MGSYDQQSCFPKSTSSEGVDPLAVTCAEKHCGRRLYNKAPSVDNIPPIGKPRQSIGEMHHFSRILLLGQTIVFSALHHDFPGIGEWESCRVGVWWAVKDFVVRCAEPNSGAEE